MQKEPFSWGPPKSGIISVWEIKRSVAVETGYYARSQNDDKNSAVDFTLVHVQNDNDSPESKEHTLINQP